MKLKTLEISGFKSFGKKATLVFDAPITAIVGPNGSGKSNVAEAFRWVLGEQSLKSLRGKRGEDLIFSGPQAGTNLNRASVAVIFDNSDRGFDLDYDEVKISRSVFRDGTNEYSINGSNVRLRDILELLSKVSLGNSGHHIISQGEADRILLVSMSDRRTMIEEALGLKLYQWKLDESEKKLTKTEDNKKQVESLRREIAPHLKFLKKQVEKIERTDELRRELKNLYREYLKREKTHLDYWQTEISQAKGRVSQELQALDTQISHLSETLNLENVGSAEQKAITQTEEALRRLHSRRDEISRQLGRLEGVIEVKQARLGKNDEETDRLIPLEALRQLGAELKIDLDQALREDEVTALQKIVSRVREHLDRFLTAFEHSTVESDLQTELTKLKSDQKNLEAELKTLAQDESQLLAEISRLKQTIRQAEDSTRGAERDLFELKTRRGELNSKRSELSAKEETWRHEESSYKREIEEALVLVDREILLFAEEVISVDKVIKEDRSLQEERRRQIEKIKIRLEDMGVEGVEVLEEFKEVTERDAHLAKELIDLETSATALKEIMAELREKINQEFQTGIKKINQAFQEFFEAMFGGGSAKLEIITPPVRKNRELKILSDEEVLDVVDEETVIKEGIDINVSLPKKRIKGLAMLSGGERALTSIALLFAMSQVNPPPFLVLDETDAALDEANSRKYARMVTNLSTHSQLIVITHNRETMAHAGILYGVTMGADGISRLLSIRFDEATEYAK